MIPSGARVWINDEAYGTTPVVVPIQWQCVSDASQYKGTRITLEHPDCHTLSTNLRTHRPYVPPSLNEDADEEGERLVYRPFGHQRFILARRR